MPQDGNHDLEASKGNPSKAGSPSDLASAERLLNGILIAYCVFFAMHRIADVAYLATVDCQFPKGLENMYTSDAERMRCVHYTQKTITASMTYGIVNFVIVMMLVCTRAFVKLDTFLRCIPGMWKAFWESLPPTVQTVGECCASFVLCPIRALGSCLNSCSCLCGCFQTGGRCELDWGELIYGAIYLTLFSAFFTLLSIPFSLWRYNIDSQYGFGNVLTTSPADFRKGLIAGLIQLPISGIFSNMLYLAIVRWRFGWFFMWAGLLFMSTFAQYNMGLFGPMLLGAADVFPDSDFGVGRGFPFVSSKDPEHPWVSVNRIYYGTNESNRFATRDMSAGSVELAFTPNNGGSIGKWDLRDADASHGSATYAETRGLVDFKNNSHDLEPLEPQPWSVQGASTSNAFIGMRDGHALRQQLFDFAEARGIHIEEVYMIDGSYQDSRANAFAAGAGPSRIIGLYDTLFLGSQPQSSEDEIPADKLLSMRHLGSLVRGVPNSESTHPRPKWRIAPIRAMTDAEILSVMGHELGHSALHHSELGMYQEAATSFLSFAALGWVVHSPVVAAALGLTAPLAHVAVFLYNHVVSPTLDGFVKLFTDAISRRHEFEADAYSAKVSETYAEGLQTSLAKLTVNCDSDPNEPWFYEMLHSDHPSLAKRWSQVNRIRAKLYSENTSVANNQTKPSVVLPAARHANALHSKGLRTNLKRQRKQQSLSVAEG